MNGFKHNVIIFKYVSNPKSFRILTSYEYIQIGL